MENNSDEINYLFFCRLKDYPHYCQHLASIPHFMEFPPSLIEFIEYGQQSREPLLAGRNIQVNKINIFIEFILQPENSLVEIELKVSNNNNI